MKVFLMHRDRDLDLERPLPANAEELAQDLELDTLWDAMAAGDGFLREIARRGLLLSLADVDAILYRQRVLADCLAEPDVVRRMYALAIEVIEAEKKIGWFWSRDSPEWILHRSLQLLELHVRVLERLRGLAEEHGARFRSEGFARFFAMLREELDDAYLARVQGHLRELRLKRGVLASVELGKGNKGRRYVVRKPHERSWAERLSLGRPASFSFTIPDRDENGFRALADIRGRAVNPVADALARSAEHVKSFFAQLRAELAFYLGCLNLRERLEELGEPTCFPVPLAPDRPALAAAGLYDPCLALHLGGRVVGNDVDADGKTLMLITGANQGGKSTFLRSVGVAQLMLQSGMPVAAESFAANVCRGVFTHFKREEDASMRRGKLDEELARMSAIADAIAPGSLLLCNESFASTNEREGSEIARQVVGAMVAKGIKVCFVTHLFELADGLYRQELPEALFLRADRRADGGRTFRLVPGAPLPTSYGADSYRRVFGAAIASAVEV